MIPEDVVLNFAASSISSIWALESLLMLKQSPNALSRDELIRRLRGSEAAVSQALDRLVAAGLISTQGDAYSYQPQTAEQGELVTMLENVYREKPVTVISAIAHAPNRKLQILSDAFKIKKD